MDAQAAAAEEEEEEEEQLRVLRHNRVSGQRRVVATQHHGRSLSRDRNLSSRGLNRSRGHSRRFGQRRSRLRDQLPRRLHDRLRKADLLRRADRSRAKEKWSPTMTDGQKLGRTRPV
jgi:hypothetical protein